MNQSKLHKEVAAFCNDLEQEFNLIATERKARLAQLSSYLSKKYAKNQIPKLIVICTHNSRRSHVGQLWLAIGADYFGLPEMQTFSGGTEATAFNPRAVKAMRKMGLDITTLDVDEENPIYQITWKEKMNPYYAFSKKYDVSPNPKKEFGAIMVCTSADEGCPIVTGCDFRLALPFEDPKNFDDTDLEAEKYDERVRQIGREVLFALSQIKKGDIPNY